MRKKVFNVLLIIYLSIGITSIALAQRQTGSLKGKITDTEGFSLPGTFISISSPALLGIQTYITSHTGYFIFSLLPPGSYKIMVEMPGFKTVNIENIIIQVGKTITLDITMEMTTIEEEITLAVPSPTLDVESTKTAVVMDKELLKNIPIAKDLHDIINFAPGANLEGVPYRPTSIINGSTVRSNTYTFDGLQMNDPGGMHLITNINFDVIEEIELETSGHHAEVGPAEGGYINVVTRSGGNKLNGGTVFYYTSDKLASTLIPEEEISPFEVFPPTIDNSLWDISLSFGGSLLEDRLWFFSNGRLISQERTTHFIPWTDPQGKKHEEYAWSNDEKLGFFKLTSQITSQFKLTGMFSYVNRYRPIYESSLSWNLTEEATRFWDHEKSYTLNGGINYIINQNTFAELKVGYLHHQLPLLLNEKASGNLQYFDEGTGHIWGSARFNETLHRKRFQTGAYLTRFQDGFLEGNHEFKAGAEYEYVYADWTTWKEDNLLMSYFNRSPFYFGLNESPLTGNIVGKGRIYFHIASEEEDGLSSIIELRRLGFFVQDSLSFADRFTLNFGIRFDRSNAWIPAFQKEASGNLISLKVGEELIKSIYEVNPYDKNDVPEWKNLMTWNAWSPRFGLSFDVYGNGKTVFKASFSRYTEYLMLHYLAPLNPFFAGRTHQFFWYDENMDGKVDINDTYTLYHEDYRLYIEEYYKERIAPDIKSPYTDEFSIGLHQEVFKDFSIHINYIYKSKRNIFENVRYSPDLDKDWYTLDQDTEGWWIPFNTTIPGIDDYPDTQVTVYFLSNNAPASFDRVKNVPELKRKYEALELVFKKRMSNNWQLNGSVVLSKTTGNIGLGYDASSGFTEAANTPNYFVNFPEDSRLDFDRPLVIKLMGTYKFPFNFFLSFYYTHTSGTPWARSVTIYPPSSWTQDKNAYSSYANVYLESPGTRRNKSYDNLDLRIEKELMLGDFAKISAYVDIINALGNQYRILSTNDGGFWFPEAENTTQGKRILSSSYKTINYLLGVRILRLGLRFSF